MPTATFNTTLSQLINTVQDVAQFFVNMFVSVADMLFNSPFVLFLGISICIGILGIVASYLRIRRGGGRRR